MKTSWSDGILNSVAKWALSWCMVWLRAHAIVVTWPLGIKTNFTAKTKEFGAIFKKCVYNMGKCENRKVHRFNLHGIKTEMFGNFHWNSFAWKTIIFDKWVKQLVLISQDKNSMLKTVKTFNLYPLFSCEPNVHIKCGYWGWYYYSDLY